ncbi:MFS transporter [Patescibacteria group bacterium]|nr:MFS transporter [Patescibacteria group bacterium]
MSKKIKDKINKVVKIMVFSDLFLNSGWGLISPILAIFIVKNIEGGDVRVAGIAVGIYLLVKSVLQVPIAHYLDLNHGEKDDYCALFIGTLLTAVTPIIFIFATISWHIYIAQIIHALGMAMAVPSWYAIFGRHIPKNREALCWGLDSSAMGLGAGITGIIGGVVAQSFGFIPLFVGVSVFNIIAVLLLLFIMKDILPKTSKQKVFLLPKT